MSLAVKLYVRVQWFLDLPPTPPNLPLCVQMYGAGEGPQGDRQVVIGALLLDHTMDDRYDDCVDWAKDAALREWTNIGDPGSGIYHMAEEQWVKVTHPSVYASILSGEASPSQIDVVRDAFPGIRRLILHHLGEWECYDPDLSDND
jgi:hypothetical protein